MAEVKIKDEKKPAIEAYTSTLIERAFWCEVGVRRETKLAEAITNTIFKP